MTTKTQLQQTIKNLKAELSQFEEQLNSFKTSTIEDASVGDTLECGSIVLSKSNGLALLVAPKSTEVKTEWTLEFPEVFKSLKKEGFNPRPWFVPTLELLEFAYKTIPGEFSSTSYWSSTEYNATNACFVAFTNGNSLSLNKNGSNCVRAFRCVIY